MSYPNQPNLPVITTDLSGRTVLVVGTNVGLGLEAAKHFARMNPAKLIVTSRTEKKCAQTAEPSFDYNLTGDGYETQVQVNHLSGALVALRLLPTLLATAEQNKTI
ncbi:hypothetical protein EUX98_g5456 [Antrodiella citrinella]|uniref:Ketoreductase (KR) domain-containing protein n=1 Tax=Antrodiella citrinella TaxID=2447956 RepID=A0A4S4MRQ2_9APHY|nr:hypothetical protein EUX98_g5456 [Antrodiella citrinella]